MQTNNFAPEILFGIVGVGLDQEEKALTKTSTTLDNLYQYNIAFDNMSGPNGSINPYSNWSEGIVVGDSGNPVFYIIDNELVLLTTWWTPTTGTFPTLSGTGKYRLCIDGNYDVINADAPPTP